MAKINPVLAHETYTQDELMSIDSKKPNLVDRCPGPGPFFEGKRPKNGAFSPLYEVK
jgi:hypothetical protein